MKFSIKNRAKFIATMAFGMLSIFAFGQEGQNLVPNGSFEAVGKKPKKLGSIESATGWVSPTGVSPAVESCPLVHGNCLFGPNHTSESIGPR